MKKHLTILSVLLFLTASVTKGQNNNYQFPNNGFENWPTYDTTSTTAVPTNWHSFSDNAGTLSSASNTNYSSISTKHVAGSYSCKIMARHINLFLYHINANGAMTTGQMIVKDADTGSDSNYIFSDVNNVYNHHAAHPFAGRPDSLSLWGKFQRTNKNAPSSSNKTFVATLKVHIHTNVPYKDIPGHAASTPQTGKIANVFCEMPSPNTSTNSTYETGWNKYTFPFTYYTSNNQVINEPTLANTTEPSYILGSFSTNKQVGGGCYDDAFFFDEVWCIYDKGLMTLSIGGQNKPSILSSLNAAEYATHCVSNNSGSTTYNYTELVCFDASGTFPEVQATTKSKLISNLEIDQATPANPNATITVTHNDNSTFTYIIHFANAAQAPTVTLNNGGIYSVCRPQSIGR